MRSAKSGFFVEGTDISMDYPDNYPLPLETEVIENGKPMVLRCLPHCSYLEKEKQIKNGFPEKYRWSSSDQRKVTFHHRRLEVDDKRDKIFVEFLERSPWIEGNESKKVRDNTKTIYQIYDEDALVNAEIADEAAITKAKNMVFALKDSELRNLYRLANPGVKTDGLIRLNQMRRYLLDVAQSSPEFIMQGIKTNHDKIIVLCSQAVEENIVNLNFPGQIAIFNQAGNTWEQLIPCSDGGGPEDKFDRLIEYLETEQGSTDLTILQDRVAKGIVIED